MVPIPRHVLITGASTGIGRACVLRLAGRGWAVHAGVRRDADSASILAEAGPAGAAITPVLLDVTDPGSITAAAARIQSAAGAAGLAGLVNNAGVSVQGPIEMIEIDDWRRQFEVNLFGQIAVTRALLPLLRRHAEAAGYGSARIVMIGSIAGRIAQPILSPYCASKFALGAVTDALRLELRPQGIRVSLVEPGAIKSEIWRKGLTEATKIDPTAPMVKRYSRAIESLAELARRAEKNAIPASRAAAVVERCLSAGHPPRRVLVGRDAKTGAFMKSLLPAFVFEALLAKAFGLNR